MIRYFNRNETNFNHNETILNPISCFILEEANGMFELEAEFPKITIINDGDIIKAPTPKGEQLFRIYRVKKSLNSKKVNARHIFYDLSKNFLIDVNLDNVSGFTALQTVLDNSENEHNFIGTSEVLTQNSARYERINPIQAIIGEDNSILNLWGGNLIRDNFNINIKANGTDCGFEIRLGKNLIGIDADIDESSVKTRIYPTVILGDNDTVYSLPEKYIDSPYINNYGEPIIYTEEIKLTDEQKILPIEDIYNIMRDYCNDLFSTYNIDKPIINYKVDFVELSKTEQYKHLAMLEQLDLYDIVTVNVSHLDINVKARVIKYKYDCMKERYESIELGDFSSVSNYKTDNIVKQLQSGIKASQSAAEYATNVITGNKGGYVVTRRYPDGKPYEFLVMDTEDINTAQNVFRLNNSGLGFSRTGYNGTYNTAMTIDGHMVADYMDTGTLTSILLKSDNYIISTSGMQINLADGTIDSKNFKVDSSGNLTGNNATLNNGIFNGKIMSTEGNIGGWSIGSNALTSYGDASINILNGNNQSMLLDYNGLSLFNYRTANQHYGDINSVYDSHSDIGGIIISQGLDADLFALGHNTGTNSYELNMVFTYNGFNSASLGNFSPGFTFLGDIYTNGYDISAGDITCIMLNGGLPITSINMLTYLADKNHNHNGMYASSSHIQSSYTITPELTAAGNISLLGSPNAASTTWCENTFQPKESSDFRLKKNIQTLDLPDNLFMSLKPKCFEYKCDLYNKGLVFGLLAQQVENAFEEAGYDPYSYNLIELVNPKSDYTDEGLYVGKDKVHRINYNNLIPWNISMTQKLYNEVSSLKETVQKQQAIIDSQANKINSIEKRLSKLEVA